MITAAKSAAASETARGAAGVAARIGYAARGLIYFLVGLSAAIAVIEPGRRPAGMTDALRMFQHGHPLGPLLIIGVALGLACLAGWYTVAGVASSKRGRAFDYLQAAARFGDAVVYAAFMIDLLGFVFGFWSGAGDGQVQGWTRWFLGQPDGRLLVGAGGIAILASGVGVTIRALRGNVTGGIDLPPKQACLLRGLTRFGYAGRGAAVALVGCFLIAAAIHGNPREAHELGGALSTLRSVASGRVLIGLFALAFLASGIADMAAALFRRFDPRGPA